MLTRRSRLLLAASLVIASVGAGGLNPGTAHADRNCGSKIIPLPSGGTEVVYDLTVRGVRCSLGARVARRAVRSQGDRGPYLGFTCRATSTKVRCRKGRRVVRWNKYASD